MLCLTSMGSQIHGINRKSQHCSLPWNGKILRSYLENVWGKNGAGECAAQLQKKWPTRAHGDTWFMMTQSRTWRFWLHRPGKPECFLPWRRVPEKNSTKLTLLNFLPFKRPVRLGSLAMVRARKSKIPNMVVRDPAVRRVTALTGQEKAMVRLLKPTKPWRLRPKKMFGWSCRSASQP